jgi:hypothetical protein
VSAQWAAIVITFMACVTAMVCVSMICADRAGARELSRELLGKGPDQPPSLRGVS